MKKRTWREKMEALGVTHKDCSKCGGYKHFDEFWLDLDATTGLKSACIECSKVAWADWSLDNDRLEYRTKYAKEKRAFIRDSGLKSRRKHRANVLIRGARTRAGKAGIPYDLDDHVEELRIMLNRGRCVLTDLPFDLSPTNRAFSPSIDRIDPAKGYVFGNVRFILHAMNTFLGNWGEEDAVRIAKAFLDKRN